MSNDKSKPKPKSQKNKIATKSLKHKITLPPKAENIFCESLCFSAFVPAHPDKLVGTNRCSKKELNILNLNFGFDLSF